MAERHLRSVETGRTNKEELTARDEREKIILKHLLSSQYRLPESAQILADQWTAEVEASTEKGYDQAVEDVAMKLQALIPASVKTVPQAQVQGAWRDAARVALGFLGKYCRQ